MRIILRSWRTKGLKSLSPHSDLPTPKNGTIYANSFRGEKRFDKIAVFTGTRHMTDSKKREESFEIIELATDSLEELARAFELIEAVCTSREQSSIELSEEHEELTIH